jgi:hypothetical protein
VNRAGFALPLMLAVLAVGSILLAATFFMGRLELQSGENGLNSAHALEAAESGLAETVAWWDPVQYNQMAIGSTLVLPSRSLGRAGYRGTLTRLSPDIFQVEARGWYHSAANLPLAQRALRSLVRLPTDAPAILGALTVIDSAKWDAASIVSGFDTIPPGWPGCVVDSPLAGLAAAPPASLHLSACSGCLAGFPPLLIDSAISVAMLSSFGRGGYAGLAGRAAFSLVGTLGPVAPRVTGSPSQCDVSDSLNWGEPRHSGPFAVCGNYHPVIHSPDDLVLTGGRGQGTLLVDGDLEWGGNFEFYGTVIIQGTLRNGPGGGAIVGAVLARQVSLDSLQPASSLSIRYSACVLPISTRGSSQAIPLPYRSWAQIF